MFLNATHFVIIRWGNVISTVYHEYHRLKSRTIEVKRFIQLRNVGKMNPDSLDCITLETIQMYPPQYSRKGESYSLTRLIVRFKYYRNVDSSRKSYIQNISNLSIPLENGMTKTNIWHKFDVMLPFHFV